MPDMSFTEELLQDALSIPRDLLLEYKAAVAESQDIHGWYFTIARRVGDRWGVFATNDAGATAPKAGGSGETPAEAHREAVASIRALTALFN